MHPATLAGLEIEDGSPGRAPCSLNVSTPSITDAHHARSRTDTTHSATSRSARIAATSTSPRAMRKTNKEHATPAPRSSRLTSRHAQRLDDYPKNESHRDSSTRRCPRRFSETGWMRGASNSAPPCRYGASSARRTSAPRRRPDDESRRHRGDVRRRRRPTTRRGLSAAIRTPALARRRVRIEFHPTASFAGSDGPRRMGQCHAPRLDPRSNQGSPLATGGETCDPPST
jgi:hypothetical protein